MKKFLVRTDIEGISGVVSYEQAVPGNDEYAEGRELFMGDLLALIEGLNEGGADEIYLYDEHCFGRNIQIDRLPDNVFTYAGKPPYRPDWAGGLDSSFTGLILLGFHSKADSQDKLLDHSYESDIRNIEINGLSVGEIGNEAAIAGDMDVPLLLVTGDSEGIREAQALVPEVKGVIVKDSCSEFGGLCYPAGLTRKWIREAAKEAAKQVPASRPFKAPGPVTMRIEFYDTPFAREYRAKYGEAVFHEENVLSCWARYLEAKRNMNR